MDTKEKILQSLEAAKYLALGLVLKHFSREVMEVAYNKIVQGQEAARDILVDNIPNAFQAFPYTLSVHEATRLFTENPRNRLIATSLIMAAGILITEAIAVPVKNTPFNWGDVIAESVAAGTTLGVLAKSASSKE